MIKQILSVIATVGLTVNFSAGIANALIPGMTTNVGSYGEGTHYYNICNVTDNSVVTFYVDETGDLEHRLDRFECITVWTNWDYIVVDYDDSWADGDQLDTVRVNYPEDVNFINWGRDAYGELIYTETY